MKTFEHDTTKVDRRFRRALKGNLHDTPFHSGGLEIALYVIASHHVEDNIGTLAACRGLGDCDEVFTLIVNGEISAELAARIAFFRRSCCRDHPRTKRAR